MLNRRRRGSWYEHRAEQYLISQGMHILDRNFRTRSGEIDRIAEDDGVLVFVEVKMRKGGQFGTAVEAVDAAKLRQVVATAQKYLAEHPEFEDVDIRYDVVAFDVDEDGKEELTHIRGLDLRDV